MISVSEIEKCQTLGRKEAARIIKEYDLVNSTPTTSLILVIYSTVPNNLYATKEYIQHFLETEIVNGVTTIVKKLNIHISSFVKTGYLEKVMLKKPPFRALTSNDIKRLDFTERLLPIIKDLGLWSDYLNDLYKKFLHIHALNMVLENANEAQKEKLGFFSKEKATANLDTFLNNKIHGPIISKGRGQTQSVYRITRKGWQTLEPFV